MNDGDDATRLKDTRDQHFGLEVTETDRYTMETCEEGTEKNDEITGGWINLGPRRLQGAHDQMKNLSPVQRQ